MGVTGAKLWDRLLPTGWEIKNLETKISNEHVTGKDESSPGTPTLGGGTSYASMFPDMGFSYWPGAANFTNSLYHNRRVYRLGISKPKYSINERRLSIADKARDIIRMFNK